MFQRQSKCDAASTIVTSLVRYFTTHNRAGAFGPPFFANDKTDPKKSLHIFDLGRTAQLLTSFGLAQLVLRHVRIRNTSALSFLGFQVKMAKTNPYSFIMSVHPYVQTSCQLGSESLLGGLAVTPALFAPRTPHVTSRAVVHREEHALPLSHKDVLWLIYTHIRFRPLGLAKLTDQNVVLRYTSLYIPHVMALRSM
ncbi:hypothetical protein EVAR_80793_1 [Eumeta japonica]|uniref:Uncharacterized protein n=1 Tax=Eumeta variegata TaxID=151549 RepID=A0A4C1WG74_EUMVA|nr:hypothetical protein EVAR_80793_1 [Eumeta japonica]